MSETTPTVAPEGAPPVSYENPTDAGQSVETADQNADAAAAADDGTQEPDADDTGQRPRGTGKRVSELLEDRHYERQARATAEARAQALEAQLAQYQQGGQPAPKPSGPQALPPDLAAYVGSPPDASQFPAGEFDPAYAEERALYRFKAEGAKAQMAQRQAQAQHQQHQAMQELGTRLNAAVEQGRAKFADFDAAMDGMAVLRDPKVGNLIREEIAGMEDGAAVAYWLAKNPQEAARVAKMDARGVVREMGRIEARLSAAAGNAPPPQPTAAPAPPRTVRGAASSGSKALGDMTPDDFARKFYG